MLGAPKTAALWHYQVWRLSIWPYRKLPRKQFISKTYYVILPDHMITRCYSMIVQGAQHLICGSNIQHSRTKHIDLRHHFIRDCCASGVIELHYMPSNHMLADIFTKGLTGHKHIHCQNNLGMIELRE